MTKLSADWTKHLKHGSKEAKDFEEYLFNSHALVERLHTLLLEKLEALDKPSEKDYECPNWAYLQAHRNGKMEVLRQLLKLTDHVST